MLSAALMALMLACKTMRDTGAKGQEAREARRAQAAKAQQAVRFGEHVVVPELNVFDAASKQSSPLGAAVHGTHNVLMQFSQVPDAAMRAELTAQGAKLGGYVGGNAYYAQVPEGAQPSDFASAGAIAVVPIAPEWKVSSLLQPERIPEWAARSGGRVEVVVSWFPNVNASFVKRYMSQKGYTVAHISELFSSATVTLPQAAVLSLAAETWVQHVGPVSPPMELQQIGAPSPQQGEGGLREKLERIGK